MQYISVDIEATGCSPRRHSLLAIGACVVGDRDLQFYVELQPDNSDVDPDAVAVSGLDPERLAIEGIPASEAISRFAAWVAEVAPPPQVPVFVAFNAPFDWMFVAHYFDRYLDHNPFGHSALDIKALAMGAAGTEWSETSFAAIASDHGLDSDLPHHALEDALLQAELFERIQRRAFVSFRPKPQGGT